MSSIDKKRSKQMAEIQKLWKTNKPDSNTPQDMLDLLGRMK